MEDETGSASFLIFGRLAADLIGLPANTLTHSHEDRFTVPLLMTRIYEIEHIFQVVISNKIEDPYNLSFKVTNIFKQEEISRQDISGKTKLNPFTSTLFHKPLIGNTSKTVKRTLTFGESSVPENDKKSNEPQVVELSASAISVDQLQVDLFPDESHMKKIRYFFYLILRYTL